jgi:hypothetical protein
MSVSAIQMPWLAGNTRLQPDVIPARVADQKPVLVVQPIPENPTAQAQPQWPGYPQKAPLPAAKGTAPAAETAALPDIYFPDPLPDLPKIDTPAPKADYPAALEILGGSAKPKLG